jgi:hypothetical protein
VKFIEQQLVAALTETPHETECSLSAALLKSIGLADVTVQAIWLSNHRPAKEGKSWQAIGEHWEYTADPVPDVPIVPIALPSGMSWRTSPANAERRLTPIVVKPVPPLASRAN